MVLKGARYALEHKLLAWTLALVVAPTFVCVFWLNRTATQAMANHHAQNVAILAQTLASALGTRSEGETLEQVAGQRLKVLNLDQRLAFIAVTDPEHRILYRRAIDTETWMSYRCWVDTAGQRATAEVGKPVILGDDGEMVVHRVAILNPPLNLTASFDDTGPIRRTVEGYVTLGMREPALPATLRELRTTQMAAACVICLICLPIGIWSVRRVTGPLRQLVDASLALASGGNPEPVRINRHDEVGMLGQAFNFMIQRLTAARSLLQHANEELEHKVQQRTMDLQRLNEQLERTARQFETLAATDPLTGLHNRRAFNDALTRACAEADRYDENLAVVMIDLDGFKQLNDTLGHQKGDELLQIAGSSLQVNCRGSDIAGRFGGDEFVLLLPRADELTARRVAERVQDSFNSAVRSLLDRTSMDGKVTMSLGLATREETDNGDPDQILARADHALYRAKELGKNRVIVFKRSEFAHPPVELQPAVSN